MSSFSKHSFFLCRFLACHSGKLFVTDLGTDRIYVFSKDEDGEDEADFFGKSGGGPGQFKVRSEDPRA